MSTLQELREDRPHHSFSEINQFVNICSLQYAFQRVYRIPKALTPYTLSFGSTFHRTLEWVYRSRKENKPVVKKEAVELFSDLWKRQLDEDQNVKFNDATSPEGCAKQGRDMVATLIDSLDAEEKVIEVNKTFVVQLVDNDGIALETPIIGEIDAVVEKDSQVIIEDWKTAGRKWPKDKAAKDLQPSVFLYAYWKIYGLLPKFRFTVVVKNKAPVIEAHITERTQDDFVRLVELVKIAEKMIEAECFLPNEQSFYCENCQFQSACKSWHRNRSKLISLAA